MKTKPLVSVVIPTKNSSSLIEFCIKSIKSQTYKNIQLIIVDNNSTDRTKDIAKKFTTLIFNKGPERSAQRNFGAKKSGGEYILFIDSDMTLGKNAIMEAVEKFEKYPEIGALIIPEKSIGKGFWGRCKVLEKSFYRGVGWIEAARFYRKTVFDKIGGFDSTLISGEDWDLSNRSKKEAQISRIDEFVTHNEGKISLVSVVKKKYYYSIYISRYLTKNKDKLNIMIIDRYKLFLSDPKKLFKDPILGIGLLFMKTCEFSAGAFPYIMGSLRSKI